LERLPPIHPGEILLEEYLKPLGVSQARLAEAIGVSARQVGEVVRGTKPVTGDLALRLARYLGTTPRLWMNLQAHYDLELAEDRLGDRIEREIVPLAR
jgi:addiction module HigA family antidote